MTQMTCKNLSRPDEVRPFGDGKGHFDSVTFGDDVIGHATFEPGWQWSKHVKPIAGTDSCQAVHFGLMLSGAMTIRMDDGEELAVKAGDVMSIPPGHDAWVTSDEPCVMIDWAGYGAYAQRTQQVDVRQTSPTPVT